MEAGHLRFDVDCTSTDTYEIIYDDEQYPNLKEIIDTKYKGNPFDAEGELEIQLDIYSGGRDPDTDPDTCKWVKPYEEEYNEST